MSLIEKLFMFMLYYRCVENTSVLGSYEIYARSRIGTLFKRENAGGPLRVNNSSWLAATYHILLLSLGRTILGR